jgi:hypothetical protein
MYPALIRRGDEDARWPVGRVLDVLVANRHATALSPSFRQGVNLMEAGFFDPGIRRLYTTGRR